MEINNVRLGYATYFLLNKLNLFCFLLFVGDSPVIMEVFIASSRPC